MTDEKVPFGQDRATRMADANKLIRVGVVVVVGSLVLTGISQHFGGVVVASPFLLIMGLGSLICVVQVRGREVWWSCHANVLPRQDEQRQS